MVKELIALEAADLVDENVELTMAELCRACDLSAEFVFELVDEGVVVPRGRDPRNWRFSGVSVRRARCAVRLSRDLGVNLAGAALALELLDELEVLRARLRRPGR